MSEFKRLKYYFGVELGLMLAEKITPYCSQFNRESFIQEIEAAIGAQELKQRVETIADALQHQLPKNYSDAISVLHKILGPENRNETGMFTEWYWLMPVAFFVEKYGLDDYNASIQLIEEITKRNTGEYAIRPFLLAHPTETLAMAKAWSKHKNFHVRRLASEGLRPRLPWAKKITLFSHDPSVVIAVLENLKVDPSAYVRKSVANNLADFLKENYAYTIEVLEKWAVNANKETRWIIKHALRNEIKKENPIALQLVNILKSQKL
jgi:3-methyladenine DNA glycosylase AlkC